MIGKDYLRGQDEVYGIKLKIDVNIGQVNEQKLSNIKEKFNCDTQIHEETIDSEMICIKLDNNISIRIYEKYVWIGTYVKCSDVTPAIQSIIECIKYIQQGLVCEFQGQILEVNFYDYIKKEKYRSTLVGLFKSENVGFAIEDINYRFRIKSERFSKNITFGIKDFNLDKDAYIAYIYYGIEVNYATIEDDLLYMYSEFEKNIKNITSVNV